MGRFTGNGQNVQALYIIYNEFQSSRKFLLEKKKRIIVKYHVQYINKTKREKHKLYVHEMNAHGGDGGEGVNCDWGYITTKLLII